MRYNVAQLLKDPTGSARSYELNEDLDGPAPLEGLVRGQVWLLRTHHGILVRAEAETPLAATCSRCLADFAAPVGLTVEEEFFPVIDVNTGRTVPMPEGVDEDANGEFRIDANHILDLTEMLRQCMITATPMKPLCQPQCRGLCLECGANLNSLKSEACGCDVVPRDPRWGALAELLQQKQV